MNHCGNVNSEERKVNISAHRASEWSTRRCKDLSGYVEGHSHTEERAGGMPEPKELEDMVGRVDGLIRTARAERVLR